MEYSDRGSVSTSPGGSLVLSALHSFKVLPCPALVLCDSEAHSRGCRYRLKRLRFYTETASCALATSRGYISLDFSIELQSIP